MLNSLQMQFPPPHGLVEQNLGGGFGLKNLMPLRLDCHSGSGSSFVKWKHLRKGEDFFFWGLFLFNFKFLALCVSLSWHDCPVTWDDSNSCTRVLFDAENYKFKLNLMQCTGSCSFCHTCRSSWSSSWKWETKYICSSKWSWVFPMVLHWCSGHCLCLWNSWKYYLYWRY